MTGVIKTTERQYIAREGIIIWLKKSGSLKGPINKLGLVWINIKSSDLIEAGQVSKEKKKEYNRSMLPLYTYGWLSEDFGSEGVRNLVKWIS